MKSQIEKKHDLGKDVQDNGRDMHQIPHNRGKEPVIPIDVDTPADDELSLGSSPSLSLSLANNVRGSTEAKSLKKPLHNLAFSDAISEASRRARREASKRQIKPMGMR